MDVSTILAVALIAAATTGGRSTWVNTGVPVPLSARTPAEQRLLQQIERQTQISALLVEGKLAYDQGDFASAAQRWDLLLKMSDLPPELERAVRPLRDDARARAGKGEAVSDLTPPTGPERPPPVREALAQIGGTVTGGGGAGPGGAVVTLRRTDGPTPRPQPLSFKPMLQKDKKFLPHVLAVPVGSTISFRNQDEIFHNIFSLSPAAKFDTGLTKGGTEQTVKFDKTGVVELFCNIHASMNAYLVVVDTPWYAVADGAGAFQIKGVPVGEYEVQVWHESASAPTRRHVTVPGDGAMLTVAVGGDRRANPFPPDKYGNPRQQQLGY